MPVQRAVEAGLARADLRLQEVVERILEQPRTDLHGLPAGAATHLLAQASERLGPTLVLTGDADAAQRVTEDLRFFLGAVGDEEAEVPQVLHLPALDTTPFLEVAPDRRAAMDRLATLFHLARGLPFRFVVMPAAAAIRRVPPREAMVQRSMLVEAESELDRDDLIQVLGRGGYLRVPVAEDPGTFAVRGGVIDVYPPHAPYPARIDLDDWLVMSIKRFDPDDQRTVDEVKRIFIHPVRDTVIAGDSDALERVRALCDQANYPTSKTRALLDDLSAGRAFYGIDALLPAFYDHLETPLDFLPPETPVVVLDPGDLARSVDLEITRATGDHDAKAAEGDPVYALGELYAEEEELAEQIEARRHVLIHPYASVGDTTALGLSRFEVAEEKALVDLAAEDQRPLVAELKARRGGGDEDALTPVADRTKGWLDLGMRVLFTARTETQAERLSSLLEGYGVPVERKSKRFEPALLDAPRGVKAQVVIGDLQDGFAWATEGLVLVTEGEIFGTRARRKRRPTRRKRQRKAETFLQDLRELKVGDYVVHSDHGVGTYLGLERKEIAQSAMERMRGDEPRSFEVLVIEYAGNDKLFVPVTKLNLVQKFSGKEGHKPKLDRLGGSTFGKKKAKVKKAVRKLADDLLVLYAERAAARRDPLPPPGRPYAELEATFPFEETADQSRAIDDVLGDLTQPRPADRLVCGDVGFGKTEVAIRAAFRMAMAGRQVAVLCPTTVLAQQHWQSFAKRYADYPLEVKQLSRFVSKEDQRKTLAGMKEGTVDVVVGTHRILSKDVHFKDLGLLVVDEEQRFGVAHKERMKSLRKDVDVLTLTATPIPRTLQMAIGGLRDLSLITTAPVDRRAVRTFACRWDDHVIREAIQRELSRGGQVFFVYNRVEGLYERAQRLQELMPNLRIAVAHGQMGERALEKTMVDFVDGQYDVLCATAIIESGLDIPRANTMIVDRADIFGLAQLYQLRGRVGRSRERAYCYLITPPPSAMSDEARHRIEALERFTELGSGFQVASLDMELRGVGDLLGAEQSGNVALVGFDLFCHMLEEAVATLRGEEVEQAIDPELTLDVEHHLPETYIEEVGLRLTFYKRFATASDEESIQDLAEEMEDRFGPPPPPAMTFIRAMRLRPMLREYRALGCEATDKRVTLHLREDTPLDPAKIIALVGEPGSPWKLTPDMRLTRTFDDDADADAIDRVRGLFGMLRPLQKGIA